LAHHPGGGPYYARGILCSKSTYINKNQPKALPKQNEDGDEPHGGRGQDLKAVNGQKPS
jgi:hypothetical protein